jgi:hypothetical protein
VERHIVESDRPLSEPAPASPSAPPSWQLWATRLLLWGYLAALASLLLSGTVLAGLFAPRSGPLNLTTSLPFPSGLPDWVPIGGVVASFLALFAVVIAMARAKGPAQVQRVQAGAMRVELLFLAALCFLAARVVADVAAVEGPVQFDGAVLAATDPHLAAQATIFSRLLLLGGVAFGVSGLGEAIVALRTRAPR